MNVGYWMPHIQRQWLHNNLPLVLQGLWCMVKHVRQMLQSLPKHLAQTKEIQYKIGQDFKIVIANFVFFDNYCKRLLSGRKTGHQAASQPAFDILLIFPDFLRSFFFLVWAQPPALSAKMPKILSLTSFGTTCEETCVPSL